MSMRAARVRPQRRPQDGVESIHVCAGCFTPLKPVVPEGRMRVRSYVVECPNADCPVSFIERAEQKRELQAHVTWQLKRPNPTNR